MRINYHLKDRFDFGIFFAAFALVLIGLIAVYSATLNNSAAAGNFQKQLYFVGLAVIVFFIAYLIPTNTFKLLSTPVYLFSLLLLIVVIVAGKKVSGARSWLDLGPLGFQPSEFAKIGTILALSSFLSRRNTDIESFADILKALAIGFVPVALILL
ncbi:MAG: FtsW/RodA/SpoVE family cell cycle protein, partial [Ignavibacteriaceae bacterium]|nr:FtsW/RodA/SpoVE family cell cycle protein [Ignavibacteriaceae bacterium]